MKIYLRFIIVDDDLFNLKLGEKLIKPLSMKK
ncbi:hypothetical protein Niako_4294 [Niastella koreensis GR20-10]|uniref:Uncharacterized protein n=1 Tax=Niastella koreensis (strain DSM 17620 / KACC 11465 / NBRC 106392 / GR20-10) TaxID=700598 RepID=G8TFW3_NIAKG|nr:hypothetical protein Niako_4294 [Niastella koreensis GR20-10]